MRKFLDEKYSLTPDNIVPKRVWDKHQFRKCRAPILIVFGLLTGLSFAIGHHSFYNSFHQKAVDEVVISQTWILRIGILFALLVKISCVLSVSTAYIQLQWHQAQYNALTVRNLDALSGVLGNILCFFDGTVFFYLPGLTLLALVCWILPVITLVTPGTINTIQSLSHTTTQLQVAQPDFYDQSFSWHQEDPHELSSGSISPIKALSRVAMVAGVTGQAVGCTPAFPDLSYTLQFSAPAFKCQDADPDTVSQITAGYGQSNYYKDLKTSGFMTYLSWVLSDPWFVYLNRTVNATEPVQFLRPRNLDIIGPDSTSIYIMTGNSTIAGRSTADSRAVLNVTTCSLFNASYIATFNFTDGQQNTRIDNVYIGASFSVNEYFNNHVEGDAVPGRVLDARNAFAALAGSLGQLLAGYRMDHDGYYTGYTSIDSLALDTSNMGPEVENLFHNIILSTFCDSELAINSSVIDATVSSTVLRYSYDPFGLTLTYALTLGVTFLCSIIGIHVFHCSGNSYQNSFSTFLRVSSGTNMHSYPGVNDTEVGPRPARLAQAKMNMFQPVSH